MFALKYKLASLAVNLSKLFNGQGFSRHGFKVFQRRFSEKKFSDIKKMVENRTRFDKDFNAPETVELFVHSGKELRHTMIVLGSASIGLMCLNSANVVYLSWDTVSRKGDENQSWWNKVGRGPTVKYAIVVALIMFGFVIPSMGYFYVSRIVKSLTLQKGGKSVCLETYRPFGKSHTKQVDLEHMTLSSYQNPNNVIDQHIKVKGKKLAYLVDMRAGKILDREAFYKTVGVSRRFR